MGFLSNLKTKVAVGITNFAESSVGLGITKVASKIQTVALEPVKSILTIGKEGAFSKLETKTQEKTFLKKSAELAENTLAVVAPFTSLGKTAIAKVAVGAVSTVPKALATTAVLGTSAGLISTSAGKTILSSAPTPSDIFTTTKKSTETVVNFLDNPKSALPSELDWISVAKGLGLGAGVAILAGGGIYLGYKLINGKLEKQKEEKQQEPTFQIPKVKDTEIKNSGTEQQPIYIINQYPTPPTEISAPVGEQTTKVKTTTTKKKAKKKTTKKKAKKKTTKKKAKKKTTKKKAKKKTKKKKTKKKKVYK